MYLIIRLCIMLKILSLFFLFTSFIVLKPDSSRNVELKLGYIDQYKSIAIAEMYRTGIPASIILAQGLLESQAGTSDLATYANNHFGIKCKTYWQGNTYYHKDDDYNKKGKLIKSCFRNYDNVLESFIDHSNFLLQTDHYSPLFKYSRTDFANWAWGLKSCGYSTDNQYPIKLIKLIHEFELYKYDTAINPWNELLKEKKAIGKNEGIN